MESHETSAEQSESHGSTALHNHGKEKARLLDFLRAAPSKDLWLLRRLGATAPHAFLRRVATLRARSAAYAPILARTVDWRALRGRCKALGLGFPVAAALYMLYGPLGTTKSGDEQAAAAALDDEAVNASQYGNSSRVVVVTKPEWAGVLLDLADDPAAAALSVACTSCVFWLNMERLGLGNMYMHAFTFALLCAAPVLVFAVAALTIHKAALGSLVGAAGALLSVLNLLCGGFRRAQMRSRLGLPGNEDRPSMCGAAADYAKWLLCVPCALAQEVRTANLYEYHVKEGNLDLCSGEEDASVEGKTSIGASAQGRARHAVQRRQCRSGSCTAGQWRNQEIYRR